MDKVSRDKEYRYRNGKSATILTTSRTHQGRYTVVSMTEHGSLQFHDEFGTSTTDVSHDLVEVPNWDCFYKGQIVEVRRGGCDWRLRRFHSISSCGKPMTFSGIEGCLVPIEWDECRAPCAWDADAQKGPCEDEVGPYDRIRKGDIVEVRLRGEKNWRLRRFSKISDDGYPIAYCFFIPTVEAYASEWDECRLICHQEDEAWRTP